jgi:hypothetical protein
MHTDYDLFEQFPDGSVMWRGFAASEAEAQSLLSNIAKKPSNEYFAVILKTNEITVRVNGAGTH